MTTPTTREKWEALRVRLGNAAIAEKNSQGAVLDLSEEYRRTDAAERREVDGLLCDWVLSNDENIRFDAIALIYGHCINAALPALRDLSNRLERSAAVSAPYEHAKVLRVIGKLTTSKIMRS